MSTPAIGANAPNASRRAIDSTLSTVARCPESAISRLSSSLENGE